MESGSGYGKGGAPRPTPIPQPDLTEMIEARIFVSEKLVGLLDDSYAADAQQTSLAVQSACEAYDGGRLSHLGGTIVNRLREIVRRKEPAT